MDVDCLQDRHVLTSERRHLDSLKDEDSSEAHYRKTSFTAQSNSDQVNNRTCPRDPAGISMVVLNPKNPEGKLRHLTPEPASHDNFERSSNLLEGVDASCHEHGTKRLSPMPLIRQRLNKRVRNTPKTWNEHRSRIQGLYIDQGKSLAETRKVLAEEYGFHAS